VSCSVCKSTKHLSLLHVNKHHTSGNDGVEKTHGGEAESNKLDLAEVKCTQICGNSKVSGKSCAKIVLVDIFSQSDCSKKVRTYAILDDQSNRSLAHPTLFSKLDLPAETTRYTLHSCSGTTEVYGRKASN
jgi:hypothetical protein